MRSSSGGGTVSSMLAVQMNSTLRQIERHVEIVVAEGVVLLRVQRLKQRRGRIAAEVAAQLVDLVQHDDRVVGFGAANALDDLAGQRADVGAAMAANLGLVVHAAQRDALELAAQGAGNRPAQAGFAHARRPDEAEDRPLHVGLQFEHAQVIENAVLHLFQLVVVLVENLLGLADVDLRAGALGPGQHGQPLDVVAGERVVGGHGRHAREPRELLQGLFLHVFRHAGGFDLLAQLVDLALALVLLAQFLLDGLELLAQVVVALRLLHLVLHLGLDLGAQLLHLDLLGQMLVQQLQPARRCWASPAAAACRRWSGTAARRRQNPPGGRALRCSRRWCAARRRGSATRRRSAGTAR